MNEELSAIYEADQADRRDGKMSWDRDSERLARVKQLLSENAAVEGADYYHAAMPFQHSQNRDDVWRAHELCLKAVQLGYDQARWLAAAAYDRWLMNHNREQKYGTQYQFDGERWVLWQVDPATTDEERGEWHVPRLEDALRQASEIPVHGPAVRARLRYGDLEVWVWPLKNEFAPADPQPAPTGPRDKTGPVLIGWAEDESEPEMEALTIRGLSAILVAGRKDGNMHLVVSLGDSYELFFGSSREDLLVQAGKLAP